MSDDKPIHEVISEMAAEIPEEELAKLPTDGASNHDKYLYGEGMPEGLTEEEQVDWVPPSVIGANLRSCDITPAGATRFAKSNDRLRTIATLRAKLATAVGALEWAAVRLEILTGRMRACHQETGKHELLDEAEAFCGEARSALTKLEAEGM